MSKIDSIVKAIQARYATTAGVISRGLFVLITGIFVFFLLFPSLFSAPFIIIQLALTGAMVISYSLFAEKINELELKKEKMLIKITATELGVFLMGIPILKIAVATHNGAIFTVAMLFSVIAIILVTVFMVSETGNKFFACLESGLQNIELGEKETASGDVMICTVKADKERGIKERKEILPFQDRFLHMLILGPTGSGKTSQIILPMLNQDVQNLNCGVTVLEPKGDLAIKAKMMAEHYGRPCVYFDPTYKNCPKYNPLAGREVDVVENIATTFRMLNPDSPQFFLDLNEQLVRNAIKVLKRLDKDCGIEGKYATLINLGRLLQNSGGAGREMVNNFSRITADSDTEAKENADIATWFLNDYFPERSKVYENTSGIRSQVSKLVSNEYLREVLNPNVDNGEKNEINFDKHLAEGGIICISTAQGALRGLSKYLGYFIILSLQSSVFRRPGNEDTRRPHFLYIDEFQTYSTPGFADMLTQGRSYRVASILATQARAQMAMGGGKDGKNFVELVSTNARNIVLFPGCSRDDAKYYSEQFGEYEKTETMVGVSRKKFDLFSGGLSPLGHPSETIREQKKMVANFSITDLIYGQEKNHSFGEIVYSIIKQGSVQQPLVGKVNYIPKELNGKLNKMIEEYTAEYARESAADYYKHEDEEVIKNEAEVAAFKFFDDKNGEIEDLPDLAGGETLVVESPLSSTEKPQVEDYEFKFADDVRDEELEPIDWNNEDSLEEKSEETFFDEAVIDDDIFEELRIDVHEEEEDTDNEPYEEYDDLL